jgi:hypothetical protein
MLLQPGPQIHVPLDCLVCCSTPGCRLDKAVAKAKAELDEEDRHTDEFKAQFGWKSPEWYRALENLRDTNEAYIRCGQEHYHCQTCREMYDVTLAPKEGKAEIQLGRKLGTDSRARRRAHGPSMKLATSVGFESGHFRNEDRANEELLPLGP